MPAMIALVSTILLLPFALRLVVTLAATGLAIVLMVATTRLARRMLVRSAMADAKPDIGQSDQVQRRDSAVSLRLAIRQTELRSLLPDAFARGERIVVALGCR